MNTNRRIERAGSKPLNFPQSDGSLHPSEEEANDILTASSPEVMELALKYARLSELPTLTKVEADDLAYILDVATRSEILSFWIAETDHFLGHHLGLLDEDDRESYRDQQALLQDYMGQENFPLPRDQQITDYQRPYRSDLYNLEDRPIPCP